MTQKSVLWGIYPREMKLLSHKILDANVHRSFICNSPQTGTNQCPSTREQATCGYLHNEILLINKMERTTDTLHNLNRLQNNYAEKPNKIRVYAV